MTPAAPAADLHDGLWARWSGRCLRLPDTVSVHEHRYRGRPWYLLREALGGKQYRLTQRVYRFVALLDGRRTIAEAYAAFSGGEDTAANHRDTLLTALAQLHADGLLAADTTGDVRPLIARQREQRRRQRSARWLRLLSPRMPLLDPDRVLTRLLPFVRPLLSGFGLLVWVLLVAVGGVLGLMHWDELALYATQRVDDPRSWLLLVCVYPLVKALHELGHGLVAKAGGAEVHEMGITLLVFLPVPYVDASAAAVFEDKSRRVLVGAAGIMVELLLAALALLAWLQLADGLLRDAAFAIMAIGGLSTLLFNGNPLLRFDGYYVFADLVEIPNLGSRSARYYGYLAQRYLLGLPAAQPPVLAAGERPWLVFFGAASTLYRLMITLGIALFLIAVVPTLGWAMGIWLLVAQVMVPLVRQGRFLLFNPVLAGRRGRALLVIGGLLATLLGTLAWLPIGSSTQVDGVVMLPEHAIVRAGVDGFLAAQRVAQGQPVTRGELLFVLRNRTLAAEATRLQARVDELVGRLDAVAMDDRLGREIQIERLAEARSALAELAERRAGLEVRSPGDGVLQIPAAVDAEGRLIEQGTLLAYLDDGREARIRVMANQQQAARIRGGFERIAVRVGGDPAVHVGYLLDEVPAGSDTLPSAALGSRGGGAIQVDARDQAGRKALHRVFAIDVAIPQSASARFIGSRAYVRFEHAATPLLARGYDMARRLLMDRLGQ